MKESKDLQLKKLLLEQIEKTRPVPKHVLDEIKQPFYSSGREIKIGDRIVSLLVSYTEGLGAAEKKFVAIKIFHESELNEICKTYVYVKGELNTIYVIKKDNE